MTSGFVLGVDTNVLVRFFTRDHAQQAELARQIITKSSNQPIYVSLIVLVELVWVLIKVKRWPSQDVFEVCQNMLQSNHFVVEQSAMVDQCLHAAKNASCDLADALIAMTTKRAGCPTTVTFDKDAQNLADMTPAETFI